MPKPLWRKNLYLVVFRDGSTMLMWSFMSKQEILRKEKQVAPGYTSPNPAVILFIATVIDNQKDGEWLDHYMKAEGLQR